MYGQRLEQAQEHEAWDADRRAAIVLDELGLGDFAHHRTLGSLSGGQRGRLALAALLVRRPAALLLDEPTNHLDDEAAAFVEHRIRELPGIVVTPTWPRSGRSGSAGSAGTRRNRKNWKRCAARPG